MAAQQIECIEGHFAPRSAFSRRQLEKYDSARASGHMISIRCTEHANAQSRQLQCEDCERVLDLSKFSKNTRRNGTNRCMDCVAGLERAEGNEFLPSVTDELGTSDIQPGSAMYYTPVAAVSASEDHAPAATGATNNATISADNWVADAPENAGADGNATTTATTDNATEAATVEVAADNQGASDLIQTQDAQETAQSAVHEITETMMNTNITDTTEDTTEDTIPERIVPAIDYESFFKRVDVLFGESLKCPDWNFYHPQIHWVDPVPFGKQKKEKKRPLTRREKTWGPKTTGGKLYPRLPDHLKPDRRVNSDLEWL